MGGMELRGIKQKRDIICPETLFLATLDVTIITIGIQSLPLFFPEKFLPQIESYHG
jgi:hypothetical protein